MPMPLSVAAAAAQRAGMSPDAVNGIRKLLMEQAAAQGAPEQPEQPAQPEVPGQTASWLAAPATTSSSPAPGWSIPREAPPQAAAPQAPEAPRFDLAKSRGMAIYEDAMKRARESSWLAPHSIRRQAEDEARTGLELARMEMASANAQDESSQRKLDREESRLHRDASEAQQRSQWWAQNLENDRYRKEQERKLQQDVDRSQALVEQGNRRLTIEEKEANARIADLAERRKLAWETLNRKPEPQDPVPFWQKSFASGALPGLVATQASPEELQSAQNTYRALFGGGAPPEGTGSVLKSTTVFKRDQNGQLRRVK